MKLSQLLVEMEVRNTTPYYHGTDSTFNKFDVNATRVNRGSNITGVYFTPRIGEAKTFGNRIIEVRLNVRNPFYNGKRNTFTPMMIEVAKKQIKKYSRHPQDWVDNVIVPDLVSDGNFRQLRDLNGDAKREILLSGGYDSYIDGDHVVVLTPSDSNIRVIDSGR